MKRRRLGEDGDGEDDTHESTPKKPRSGKKPSPEPRNDGHRPAPRNLRLPKKPTQIEEESEAEDHEGESAPLEITPKKTPGRTKVNGIETPQKRLAGKQLFSTPKSNGVSATNGTPRIQRNANRSARRKSTRALIERAVLGYTSDNDEEEGELADQIYGSDGDEENLGDDDNGGVEADGALETPSKRRPGRPKGGKNKQRSPSPIAHDLPPYEKYFVQNRPGRAKTSNNTLGNFKLLDHEEYFAIARKMEGHHAKEIEELASLHEQSFNQWLFELNQDFNLCIYGWGSKRSLLMRFAEYVYKSYADQKKAKIVIINGYVQALTIRDVFNTIALAVADPGVKLGSQPADMFDRLLALIEDNQRQEITLIIHSIDRMSLRRPAIQTLLSRLSAHPQIRLIASADHPSFPLLWDGSLRSAYNFLFHECVTFKPYTAEVDVVDEVHELLGRSGRRIGGKDGVIFVLKSLPVNATNLFKILIGEQLATMGDGLVQVNNDDQAMYDRPRKSEEGVEYRLLYQKAVEEFICSNDMGFRSLLKEFHDHQMIQRKKDLLGTEYLVVPFRKEELESILEDISA